MDSSVAAGRELRFDDYPRDSEFIDSLREMMLSAINEHITNRE